MITCTTALKVKDGKQAELEKLLVSLVEKVRASEPGTKMFQFVRSLDDPNKYLFLEQYVDREALDFHHNTEYLQPIVDQMMNYIEGQPDILTFAPIGQDSQDLTQEKDATVHHKYYQDDISTYFHIGIIVPDLKKAIEDFSRILGITFTNPEYFHINRLEDPEPHSHDPYVAFSREGPPYYELIEASGDGIFSAKHQGTLLYLGFWEKDMKARVKTLEEEGIEIDAWFRNEEDSVPFCVITSPQKPLGIRLEYVDQSVQPTIEHWVKTGAINPDDVTGG